METFHLSFSKLGSSKIYLIFRRKSSKTFVKSLEDLTKIPSNIKSKWPFTFANSRPFLLIT